MAGCVSTSTAARLLQVERIDRTAAAALQNEFGDAPLKVYNQYVLPSHEVVQLIYFDNQMSNQLEWQVRCAVEFRGAPHFSNVRSADRDASEYWHVSLLFEVDVKPWMLFQQYQVVLPSHPVLKCPQLEKLETSFHLLQLDEAAAAKISLVHIIPNWSRAGSYFLNEYLSVQWRKLNIKHC